MFTKLIAMRCFDKASITEIKDALGSGNHTLFNSVRLGSNGKVLKKRVVMNTAEVAKAFMDKT